MKELREQAGMTQAEVAAKLEVDQSAVSRWESGSPPLRKYAQKLARLYGVSVEYLLTSEQDGT